MRRLIRAILGILRHDGDYHLVVTIYPTILMFVVAKPTLEALLTERTIRV